jgi:hypothetical protein
MSTEKTAQVLLKQAEIVSLAKNNSDGTYA